MRSTLGGPFLTWCGFPAKVTAAGWRDPGGVQVIDGDVVGCQVELVGVASDTMVEEVSSHVKLIR